MTARAVTLLILLLVAGAARAQSFPEFTGRVVDGANVIPAATEADLTAKLEALQRETKRQLVVATVPDLQGYDIRDFGYRMGRDWGVGLRDVNNGAILLVAPNERKVSIEVGTGLEGIVTDALSATIINERIVPRFKAGDLPGGIVAGADALAQQLRAAPEEAQARTDTAAREFDETHRRRVGTAGGGQGVPGSLIFWGLIFLFVVLPLMRRRRGRWGGRHYRGASDPTLPIVLWSVANELGRSRGGGGVGWGGGGSSGGGGWTGGWTDSGFSGGGGGSFSGGGASGSW
ncbi:TPM domain-containing protein [Sphingomonas lenta]|uniref:Methanol dehydrogenase n=1 Tax=Sphingomonas lenta TaxID=1141887 RepID=A0A2A2SCV5_9SPHN|nr:TPM domain-containing protein [Sphingomonas lenta]PAX07097.1 methanol dehydrogenase [Sphingomonas lenta]